MLNELTSEEKVLIKVLVEIELNRIQKQYDSPIIKESKQNLVEWCESILKKLEA